MLPTPLPLIAAFVTTAVWAAPVPTHGKAPNDKSPSRRGIEPGTLQAGVAVPVHGETLSAGSLARFRARGAGLYFGFVGCGEGDTDGYVARPITPTEDGLAGTPADWKVSRLSGPRSELMFDAAMEKLKQPLVPTALKIDPGGRWLFGGNDSRWRAVSTADGAPMKALEKALQPGESAGEPQIRGNLATFPVLDADRKESGKGFLVADLRTGTVDRLTSPLRSLLWTSDDGQLFYGAPERVNTRVLLRRDGSVVFPPEQGPWSEYEIVRAPQAAVADGELRLLAKKGDELFVIHLSGAKNEPLRALPLGITPTTASMRWVDGGRLLYLSHPLGRGYQQSLFDPETGRRVAGWTSQHEDSWLSDSSQCGTRRYIHAVADVDDRNPNELRHLGYHYDVVEPRAMLADRLKYEGTPTNDELARDLRSVDAARAWRAIYHLRARSVQLPALYAPRKEDGRDVTAAEKTLLGKLEAELGSDVFADREKASRALATMAKELSNEVFSTQVGPVLSQLVEKSPSPEVRSRAEVAQNVAARQGIVSRAELALRQRIVEGR